MADLQTIEAGAVFLMTYGQYSDYTVSAVMQAAQAFDWVEAIRQFHESAGKHLTPWDNEADRALAGWLESQGYAKFVKSTEWWIGDGELGNADDAQVRSIF